MLGISLYQGDDLGEGVCQTLSLTDQLRIGLRHIEIDINIDPENHDIITCHSPVPLQPQLVAQVEEEAKRRNITLGWDVDKLSCLKTSRTFNDTLYEVKQFLDANPQEIVILYLDTKFFPSPENAAQGYYDARGVFGDAIYLVCLSFMSC